MPRECSLRCFLVMHAKTRALLPSLYWCAEGTGVRGLPGLVLRSALCLMCCLTHCIAVREQVLSHPVLHLLCVLCPVLHCTAVREQVLSHTVLHLQCVLCPVLHCIAVREQVLYHPVLHPAVCLCLSHTALQCVSRFYFTRCYTCSVSYVLSYIALQCVSRCCLTRYCTLQCVFCAVFHCIAVRDLVLSLQVWHSAVCLLNCPLPFLLLLSQGFTMFGEISCVCDRVFFSPIQPLR